LDSPLNIFVLRSTTGSGGGAEAIILRTASAIDPSKFKLTLCGLRDINDHAYDLDTRASQVNLDYCEVLCKSKYDRQVLPQLRELVRSHEASIIHAHDYKAAYFAARLAKSNGACPLSTCHGWTGQHWRERFIYYPAERLIIRRFPLIIAVSNQIRDVLLRWGCRPEQVRVVLNGINPDEFKVDRDTSQRIRKSLGVGPNEIVLGAVGRLERQKRFDILLDAMSDIVKSRPNVKLFIAGDGELKSALHDQIGRLGLADHCTLLGHRDDMADVYQGFDLLVQSSEYEGTPTILVEAMALEIPVVATDAGGTRDLIEHGVHGLVVPIRRPDILAKAVLEALDSPAATTQRVETAKQHAAANLSFAARTSALQAIYEELGNWKQGHA